VLGCKPVFDTTLTGFGLSLVVGHLEIEVLQVEHVAGDVQGDDLTGPSMVAFSR